MHSIHQKWQDFTLNISANCLYMKVSLGSMLIVHISFISA